MIHTIKHSTEFADFSGTRRSFSLTTTQQTIEAPFNIVDDAITEIDESFTATITTSAERVTVSIPSTEVIIIDNDSKLVLCLTYLTCFTTALP